MISILSSFLNSIKILLFGKYVLRDQSHNNNVKVIFFSKKNFYRKIGKSKVAEFYLKNELRGIKWYAKRLKMSEKNLVYEYEFSNNFSKIDIKKINGQKRKFYSPTYTNEDFLHLSINHYKKYWPKNKIVPAHGDLTLDNIIFKKSSLNFFDWEHFYKKGEVWGFDLAYLIISSIILPSGNVLNFNERDKKSFSRLWNHLKLAGLKGEILIKPIFYFKNIFKKKSHWRKILNRSPNKLFPMTISNDNAEKIHSMIDNF